MNIGILSYWGRSSGLAHVSRAVAQALLPRHRIAVLKQGREPVEAHFPTVASVTQASGYLVPPDEFAAWVRAEHLQAVFFNEYNQWRRAEGVDLVATCRELGVRAVGWLVLERFDPARVAEYALYDALICPTRQAHATFAAAGLSRAVHVPWGVDVAEFHRGPPIRTQGPTFYHPGGHGGYRQRKNSAAVIDAFWRASLPSVELFLTSQHGGPPRRSALGRGIHLLEAELTFEQMRDMYGRADAVILPSRWETLGLPVLEAMAGGAPVVATDMPPLNEHITDGVNGLLVPVREVRRHPDIFVPSAEIDVDALADALRRISDDPLRHRLADGALATARERFDWARNGGRLAGVFEQVVGG